MKQNNYSKSIILSLLFFPLGILFSLRFKTIDYANLVSNLVLPVVLIFYMVVFFEISLQQFLIFVLGLNGIVSSQLLVDLIDNRNLSEGEDVFEGCSDSKIVYLIAPLILFFSAISTLVVFFRETMVFERNGLSISSLNNGDIIFLLIIMFIWIFLFFWKLYVFSKHSNAVSPIKTRRSDKR